MEERNIMKKLLALLLIAIMLTSSTAFAEYKEFEKEIQQEFFI